MADINAIADQHWQWCAAMGWHGKTTQLESLMLVVSECGEAADEVRGPSPTPAFGLELADIILRSLDLMLENGIDPAEVIKTKMAMNLTRGNKGRIK